MQVKKKSYLVIHPTIHQSSGCHKEAEIRVLKAWSKWQELSGMLCDRRIPSRLKIPIYKTSIRPALLYGNATWPLTGVLSDKVSSCEMQMITYYLGISLEKHRRTRTLLRKPMWCPSKNLCAGRDWSGLDRSIAETMMKTSKEYLRWPPKQRCSNTINTVLHRFELERNDVESRIRWNSLAKSAIGENRRGLQWSKVSKGEQR